jgi:adenylate cyclase
MFLGRVEDALAELDLGVEKTGPHNILGRYRTKALMALGRFGEASAEAAAIENRTPRVEALDALILAAEGRLEEANEKSDLWLAEYPGQLTQGFGTSAALLLAAATGRQDLANQIGAQLDSTPAGAAALMTTVGACLCGAPFDLEVTPNLQARIGEANLPWPPSSPITYPAKSW